MAELTAKKSYDISILGFSIVGISKYPIIQVPIFKKAPFPSPSRGMGRMGEGDFKKSKSSIHMRHASNLQRSD